MMMPQLAAVGASILIAGIAAYQIALALGLALGEATLGGRAPTTDGVLAGSFRAIAAASAAILILVAWLVLVRAGVTGSGRLPTTSINGVTWAIFGFLVLNTLANFAAPHPVERWVVGSITLVIAGLVGIVVTQS